MEKFYEQHLFFCTNLKESGAKCCQQGNASKLQQYAKAKLVELKRHGKGQFRVSSSGCLGRCKVGPCLVIYPEGVWYRYESTTDIDEIISEHVIGGKPVERLLLPLDVAKAQGLVVEAVS